MTAVRKTYASSPAPSAPTLEEVEMWGLDSFPASDPPQNW